MNIDNGSPSTFVVEGLELEETQYILFLFYNQLFILYELIIIYRQTLLVDLKTSANTTVGQQTLIQQWQTNLLKKIMKFSDIQNRYMLGLDRYITELSPPPKEVSLSMPELIPLHLLLSLPKNKHPMICIAGVQKIKGYLCFT